MQPHPVSEPDVLAALEHLEQVPPLANAPRLRHLLRYLVKHSFGSDPTAFSAYAVGTDCLGLPAAFDPNSNPHVRVMAGRLRKALDAAQASGLAHAPVRICLPAGSLRPVFTPASAPEDTATPRANTLASFNILSKLAAFSRPDPKLADGFYECFFPALTNPGHIMAHIMQFERTETGHRWRSMCRMNNPTSRKRSLSPVKFEGEILCFNGRMFCVYGEHPTPSMLAYFLIEPENQRFSGTERTYSLLTGINAAVSADNRRRPMASTIAICPLSIDSMSKLRHEMARTGYFAITDDRLPDAIRPLMYSMNGIATDPSCCAPNPVS